MNLTPPAEKIMTASATVAAELKLDYISAETIVIAILRDGRGIAANILQKHGVTEKEIADEIGECQKSESWQASTKIIEFLKKSAALSSEFQQIIAECSNGELKRSEDSKQ